MQPGGRVAIVLAGGAARGAYEVGVIRYLLDEVARDLDGDLPLDIFCGTSIGALNATFLAAAADDPRGRGARLEAQWLGIKMAEVVHPDARVAWDFMRSLFGKRFSDSDHGPRRGGILDPSGVERLVQRAIPFEAMRKNIAAGLIYAVTVSTTHVGSGKTVVFVESRDPLPPWGRDPTVEARAVELGPDHALASAAIPFLFPAVRVDGQFYCDGGLRQNVPLSPARRLGADGLVIISPRYITPIVSSAEINEREAEFPGPLYLLGKALNALLLDRVDNDIDRLQRINALLDAGTRHYGAGFVDAINHELGSDPLVRTRPLSTVLIRASEDIGRIAGDFVRSPEFARKSRGMLGRVMRRLAEGAIDADLLSYLLFDGEFAARLIDLGRRDARAKHPQLVAFFADMLRRRAAASDEKAARAGSGG